MWFKPKLTIRNSLITGVLATGIAIFAAMRVKLDQGDEFIPQVDTTDGNIPAQITQKIKSTITMLNNKLRKVNLQVNICILRLTTGYNINQASKMIEQNTTRCEDLRHQFLSIQNVFRTYPMRNATIHTHPESATSRSAMASYMQGITFENGWIPYNVSRAKTDQYTGSRYFYTPKDLSMKYQNDKIESNSVIIMTDVDYYADMHAWLSLFKPVLLYTFVPTKMAGTTSEYAYHFDGDEVVFYVKGGASYRHKLWVYEGDTLTTYNKMGDLLVFSVEQRQVPSDENHRYVCLLPVAKVNYPHSELMPTNNNGLKRFHNPGFLYDPITDMLSIQVDAKHQSVELPGKVYEAIKQRIASKTAPPIIADVERILRDANVNDSIIKAPLIFKHVDQELNKNVIFTSTLASYHPLTTNSLTHEDGRAMGESATSNLVYPGAAFPTNSESSEHATVLGRVQRPRNNRTPPRRYATHANDFISQVVRKPGHGTPWTVAQVRAEQDSIGQRARLTAVEHTMSTRTPNRLASFIKAEPYSTANDPRNITTMSPELTTMMSSFTYPFKNEILKKHPWYSPGMTPNEITNRLKDRTVKEGVVVTDYSRFDGSISEWLQKHIVKSTYMRWCSQASKGEFESWFDKVFTQKAKTTHGVLYDPGWGTRSGSPITTDGNTLINAFVIFCANRNLGHDIKTSFYNLGLYCGDDGYTPYEHGLPEAIVDVANDLGLTVDIEHKKEGPYPFCGRLFIDPMVCPDSFQDLKRTLPKLHLVRNGNNSTEQRITNKATGYLVTDAKTPILGTWASKIIELTKMEAKDVTHEEAYKMQHPWPQTNAELILGAVSNHLNMTSIEVNQIVDMIKQTSTLTQFPVIQEWAEETKITAVRGDIIEHASRGHNQQNTPPNDVQNNQCRQDGSRDRQAASTTRRDGSQTQARSAEHRRTNNVLPPLATTRRCSRGQPSNGTYQPPPQIHRQTQEVRVAGTRNQRNPNTHRRAGADRRN